jgi:hypothetical protein
MKDEDGRKMNACNVSNLNKAKTRAPFDAASHAHSHSGEKIVLKISFAVTT